MRFQIKGFFKKYEPKIILILGFILVASLSFEAGILKGRKIEKNPITIEKSAPNKAIQDVSGASEAQNLAQDAKNTATSPNTPDQKCAFTGSKNSNKYHLPTCRWAKNIKPENLVCFSSEDEAKSKGYLPDKTCIK
jgi:hypothetical protein